MVGLLMLVAFYESPKGKEFFNTFAKDDVNNLDNFERGHELKRRVEKAYDYVLLNDQQLEL